MMRCFVAVVALVAAVTPLMAADKKEDKKMSALDFKMTGLDGKEVDLSKYKGKVVLFVNVASKCGYTKQYTGLPHRPEAGGHPIFRSPAEGPGELSLPAAALPVNARHRGSFQHRRA